MEGNKNDTKKLRWDLLPADAVEDIVRVLSFGAEKYGDYNWAKGMAWSRMFAACMRHLWQWWRGHRFDPESGLPHLAHAACCVLFLLHYDEKCVGSDDRPLDK